MPYHEAFINELMRITSTGSIGFPHCPEKDTVFRGFLIPARTSVYASIYGVQHDPEIWGDPEVFRPERFLSPDGTQFVKHEALIPFSTGKRICPGESMARYQLFLFVSSWVQRFLILPEPGKPIPTLAVKTGNVTLEPQHYLVVMKERA